MPTTVQPLPQNVILTLQNSKGDKGDTGPVGPQGIQGVPGQPANWRGAWGAATVYSTNDGVYYNGNSYIATGSSVNKPPDTNPGVWQIVASQGLTGPIGNTGLQGNPGNDSFTTTTAAFTVPALGSTVQVSLANVAWIVIGQFAWIATAGASGGGGSFQVTARTGNLVTFLNPSVAAYAGSPVAGTNVASGVLVSSGGATGATGLTGDSLPVGAVFMFASMTPPAKSVLCDGTPYATSGYPALFAVLGYTFGGSGGTFYVPDLRSRFVVGAGQGAGLTNRGINAKGGEELHALSVAELAAHSHTISDPGHAHAVYDPQHYHGMDHCHNMDHNHTIYAGQFNHAHGLSDGGHNHGVGQPSGINYGTTNPGYNFYQCVSGTSGVNNQAASGLGVAAATLPQGATLYASQTNGAWVNTLYASQTAGAWANTGNAATGIGIYGNTTGITGTTNTGSGSGHNTLPPFCALAYMIKAQ